MNFIQFFIQSILIILILNTYYYVVELNNCPCFLEKKDDNLDLQFIKFYLLLYLFSIIISFILMHIRFNKGVYDNSLLFIHSLSILLVIFINFYMSYNVLLFYNSVKDRCSCVNKWQKFFIYYTGIISYIHTLIWTTLLLFIFLYIR